MLRLTRNGWRCRTPAKRPSAKAKRTGSHDQMAAPCGGADLCSHGARERGFGQQCADGVLLGPGWSCLGRNGADVPADGGLSCGAMVETDRAARWPDSFRDAEPFW